MVTIPVRVVGVALAGALAFVPAAAVASPAAPQAIHTTPELLDPRTPIDLAVYGRSAVWLRPAGPHRAQLVLCR